MEQYYECTDGVAIYRFGVRGGSYVVDKALTVLGFLGFEDIDWQNLKDLALS
jgi:hypothetical protein